MKPVAAKPPKPLKPIAEVALGLVSRTEHTAAQLRRKLRTKGYALTDIEPLIAGFQEKNYLNDARAAAMLVRRRALGSKWGAGRIRQELGIKGVEKDLATQVLGRFSEGSESEEGHDWLATATALLQAKYKAPLPDGRDAAARQERQKELAKRLGFLQRRGFSGAQASAALKTSLQTAPEDEDMLANGTELA